VEEAGEERHTFIKYKVYTIRIKYKVYTIRIKWRRQVLAAIERCA